MGLVLLSIPGDEPILIARIKNSQGTWLGLREAQGKIFPALPLQSFKNNVSRCGVHQRLATDAEKEFLFMKGAIKARARLVSVIEVTSFCRCVKRLGSRELAEAVASIARLPLYNGEHSKRPGDLSKHNSHWSW